MKHFLLYLFITIVAHTSYAQSGKGNDPDTSVNKIYTKVDVEASFPGGEKAWQMFLQKNINMMLLSEKNAPKGNYTAMIKFIIKEDGTISNITCETDPGYGVCDEGISIIELSPKWNPAMVNGQRVSAYTRIPFSMTN